jgi:membrane protease subunit HflK
MAWNEPGGGNRDPWNSGGRDQGPPDLDEVVRKLSDKFNALLGNRRGGNNNDNNSGGSSGSAGSGGGGISGSGIAGIGLIVGIIALIGWLIASIYIVNEGERGVVLRFGRYLETTMPGPHLRLFPIDRVEIVNLEQRRFREIGYRSGSSGARQPAIRSVPKEALMLTQDENIVDMRLAVQYQIHDPRAYLFSVLDPEAVLVQVVESATRETIGKSTMDFVLTEGRSAIVSDIQKLSQRILDQYAAGLQIITVVLQDAQPPEEVQDAFADAIKAREDEQRLKNEAEAYSNEVIPRARGQAARRLQEASAYKEQVIAQAQGETSRFNQLLAAYQKAPTVTRERLYLETMESVLSQASKVLVDMKGTNNLLYLPLDRLLKPHEGPAPSSTAGTPLSEALRPVPRRRWTAAQRRLACVISVAAGRCANGSAAITLTLASLR